MEMHFSGASKPLIKFRHCGRSIYSFSVPQCCPLCQGDVGSTRIEDAPISISDPFSNGHQEKCSFLLKPTRGTFLREYDGKSDLHVGLTNTRGVVYNYNTHGIQRDEAGWEQSLSVPLVQPSMFGLLDQWDKYLEDFSASAAWLPHRYEEDHHNCSSFALTFINCILAMEGKEQLDKREFTEKYVVPRTRLASKYITLYRAIQERGFHVAEHPDPVASLS
ncbi:MKRN2 opposite strand protein [Mesocricetus auratus]|uniref:MKRN2 opposite strand protein n=1 Tax=Mesocricetus auratus TaxID=10036 RepID=A0A1U7Q8F5_MESAU|nr:MKRN2 opposite strand protein [Mesocricetus auratus]